MGESSNRKKNKSIQWNCVCSCGTTRAVSSMSLNNGDSKSCGCLARETTVRLKRKRTLSESAAHSWFLKYVNGSKLRDIDFSISKDDLLSISSGECGYCGAEPAQRFIWVGGVKSERRMKIPSGFFANGIDRVNNLIGYTSENCVPCCERCNRAKLDMTVSEFKDMITKQYNHFVSPAPDVNIVGMLERIDELTKFYREAA